MKKRTKIVVVVLMALAAVVAIAQQPVSVQSITAALAAGSNTIGAVTQASGPWTTNITQFAGSSLGAISNYGTSPGAVAVPSVNAYITNTPTVAFGPSSGSSYAVTAFHSVLSNSTYNSVKASAGNFYGGYVFNPNTSPCTLMMYNSSAPTIGTTTPVYGFTVQAGVGLAIPAGGLALANFTTAITVAGTTTDGGATVCSTGMSANIFYQ